MAHEPSRPGIEYPWPADVSALETEIDQRVYALYGLSAEEIRIVEGET